jgi:hypothetical protein
MKADANQHQSSDGSQPAVRAAVGDPAGERPSYAMFELLNLTATGAFLGGPLLFEVDEAFTLELTPREGPAVLAPVRVVRLERGAVPGMEVAFADLAEDEAAAVAELLARWEG